MPIPETTTPQPPAVTTQEWRPPALTEPPPVTQPPTEPPTRLTQKPAEYWNPVDEDEDEAHANWPPAPTTRPFVHGGYPPAPPPDSSDFEPTPRVTVQVTTTPTLPQLPHWAMGNTELGPVRAELMLAAMSKTEAEELMYPSAVKAIESALVTSLELTAGDELKVEGMDLVAPDSGGRRLASVWQVRVKFTVTAVGQVQTRVILERVTAMSTSSSSIRETLHKELSEELYLRGIDMTTIVMGASALEESAAWSPRSSPSPSPSPPPPPTGASAGVYQGGSGSASAEKSPEETDNSWIVPVVVVSSVLCVGLLMAGTIYAVCTASEPEDSSARKTGKVADANTAGGTRLPNEAVAIPSVPDPLRQASKVRDQPALDTTRPSANTTRRSSSRSLSRPEESRERVGRRSTESVGKRRPSQSPGYLTSRSSQGPLTDRSSATRSSKISGDGRVSTPVKEAWSTASEQAGGSRCSTASGSKAKPSSSSSPASTARDHLVDPSIVLSDEMELQSCNSARHEVSSPSRLPLHFQSQVPPDLRSAHNIAERPLTSGTSNTVD